MRMFCEDPSAPGLNLEMLKGDRRLHSIRASLSIRILLAKEGNVYIFLEAGQHDDLYQRAERMRFISNPATGFIGLIPITVGVDSSTPPLVSARTSMDAARLFTGILDHWADRELEEAGFAQHEVAMLRQCTAEEELCELDLSDDKKYLAIDLLELTYERWKTLPLDEAIEAEERIRTALAANPESFTQLFSAAEAAAIATAPIEEWMVFLHPDQRQASTRRHAGPARVRGSAGTGKTVVALHRAAEIAKRLELFGGPDKILFTTYIKSLPPVFESLFGRLPGVPAGRVEFLNIDKLAHRICTESGDRPSLDPAKVEAAFASACRSVVTAGSPLDGFSRQYLRTEITSVIKGRGLRTVEDYLGVERTGRKTRFTEAHRRQAWQLKEEWDRQLRDRGVIDFADVILRARDHARRRAEPTYRAVIVDEAQDLTLVGLQLLRSLVNGAGGDQPDGLFIVGDGAQRIYAGGFTLKQAGVDVRGRTTVLRTNYRNTRQIIGAAMAVAGREMIDDLGEEHTRGSDAATTPRNGIRPVLKTCATPEEEGEFIVRQVRDLVDRGALGPGDVAVAVATNGEVSRVRELLGAAGFATQALDSYDGKPTDAVKVGTHFRIKGLEFKVVFLPYLTKGVFPRPATAGQDAVEYAEQRELAVSQLFVAMTRARDGLFITCTNDPSEVLDPGLEAFDVI
jgi:hypothetical protein